MKNIKNLKILCTTVIGDIIFNDAFRKRAKEAQVKKLDAKCLKEVERHVKGCISKKKYPILHNIDIIYSKIVLNRRWVPKVQNDRVLFEMIVSYVIKMWQKLVVTPYAKQNPTKMHFKDHTLACLYYLAEGYRITRRDTEYQIVPKVDYVAKFIPNQEDLCKYGEKKNMYTPRIVSKGQSFFKQCIVSSNRSPNHFCINLG